MPNILDIGVSGLNAAEYALTTASNNISNANTAGYSRELVQYTEATGEFTGSGFLGAGVDVSAVTRAYSQYLTTQLNQAQAQGGALTAYNTQAQQLSGIVGDPTAGLTTALQTFFSGVQAVASQPSDIAARQSALGDAQSLATQVSTLNGQFDAIRNGVNTQITDTVAQVNTYAQQIAQLNQQIAAQSGAGQTPNQLLDQRDQVISQLNQLVGTTVVPNADGSASVFVGTGQSLVVGSQPFQLAAVPSATDQSELVVAYTGAAGSNAPPAVIAQSALSSGSLGGLLQFRSQTLDPQQQALGNIAVALAVNVNQTNQDGVTLNGAAGSALFSLAEPTVTTGATNTGTGALSVTFGGSTSALTGDNYTLTAGAGGTYTLTDASTGTSSAVTFNTQGVAKVDGLVLTLTGTPSAGDTFAINSSTRDSAGSLAVAQTNPSALAAAQPQGVGTAASTNTGTGAIAVVTASIPASATNSTPLTASVTVTVGTSNGSPVVTFLPPQTVAVTNGGTTTYYTPPAPVPFVGTATYSFSGVSITLSGAPASTGGAPPTYTGGTAFTPSGGFTSIGAGGLTIDGTAVTLGAGTGPGGEVTANDIKGAVNGTAGINVTASINAAGDIVLTGNSSANPAITVAGTDAATIFGAAPVSATTGDSFTVTADNGVADGRNALAIANLATQNTLNGATETYSGAYAQFVNTIGTTAQQLQASSTAQTSLISQLQSQQQSVSGVNLDEEAANLLQYQQLYQANSKVIQIASSLFNTLLGAVQAG